MCIRHVSNKSGIYLFINSNSFIHSFIQRTRLILARVRLHDAVVEPHVRYGHPVLGQSPGLIGADGGRGAERFDRLEMFHETVLASHTLGGQC